MKSWPKYPLIYEINTWVWLRELGQKYQRPITLATVPSEEWDALAYTLEGSRVYDIELKGLLSGDYQLLADKTRMQDGLFFMAPYRPGRIPVVLVHGTASSPARWAEMLNELQNDPHLWGRYQFWLYTYNTGNPIVYSGGILTEGLNRAVAELDPEGKDPALRKMVVIGHSQGGLLTKLTAIDSGTRFWDNGFAVPLDKLEASTETKEILKRSMFYTPLPSVKRLVFIATPHQGSFVAGGWIGRLTGKLISLPFHLLDPLKEVFALNQTDCCLSQHQRHPSEYRPDEPQEPICPHVGAHPHSERGHCPLHHRGQKPGRPQREMD